MYSCRTSKSWGPDLALSATHYPQRGLTFAVIYGTSNTIEKAILKRLRSVKVEAAHPLLLPGILAEIELARHTQLVEASINEVETKIFELNFASSKPHDYCRSEIERRSESKRTAWLDLSYLRNSLMTWNTQLLRMIEQAATFKPEQYIGPVAWSVTDSKSSLFDFDTSEHIDADEQVMHEEIEEQEDFDEKEKIERVEPRCISQIAMPLDTPCPDPIVPIYQSPDSDTSESEDSQRTRYFEEDAKQIHIKQAYRTSEKIKARLEAIREEYDEKIRDCTMRVDGMAMATQWVSTPCRSSKGCTDSCSPKAKLQSKSQWHRTETRQSCAPSL